MRQVLLDTNAYAALLSGKEAVRDGLAEANTVYMSVFVLGELHCGFRGGTRPREDREILSRFLRKPKVKLLHATPETAEVFGDVKHGLRSAGTPIPLNDVWIAAHAIETGAVLMTFDKHFDRVPGLRLWDTGQTRA